MSDSRITQAWQQLLSALATTDDAIEVLKELVAEDPGFSEDVQRAIGSGQALADRAGELLSRSINCIARADATENRTPTHVPHV